MRHAPRATTKTALTPTRHGHFSSSGSPKVTTRHASRVTVFFCGGVPCKACDHKKRHGNPMATGSIKPRKRHGSVMRHASWQKDARPYPFDPSMADLALYELVPHSIAISIECPAPIKALQSYKSASCPVSRVPQKRSKCIPCEPHQVKLLPLGERVAQRAA